MPSICGERIQYLRVGFPMLEMTSDKRLIYRGNDGEMWEMA